VPGLAGSYRQLLLRSSSRAGRVSSPTGGNFQQGFVRYRRQRKGSATQANQFELVLWPEYVATAPLATGFQLYGRQRA